MGKRARKLRSGQPRGAEVVEEAQAVTHEGAGAEKSVTDVADIDDEDVEDDYWNPAPAKARHPKPARQAELPEAKGRGAEEPAGDDSGTKDAPDSDVENRDVEDRDVEDRDVEDAAAEDAAAEDAAAEGAAAEDVEDSDSEGAAVEDVEDVEDSHAEDDTNDARDSDVEEGDASADAGAATVSSDEPRATEPDATQPEVAELPSESPDTAAERGSSLAAPTGTDFDEFAAAAGTKDAMDRRPVEGKAAWARLLTMSKPRLSRGNFLVALLAILLGAGIAAQVQLTNQRGLAELSQTDLVRVLDDVSLRASRLDQQVRELEATRDRLKSGTGTTAEALEQAQKRVDTLGILAGTIPAKGPGITVRISDPDHQVSGPIVLDLIQELRDAGAESIDVGGVRVVASSFVGDRDGEIVVDGTAISRPIVISVIGDSKTLSSAMTIPGGIVESVRQKGANATISESSLVEITSTHTPTELKNAKPVE